MEQLELFDSREYSDEVAEIKIMIKSILEKYEDEDSWMYQDEVALVDMIKFCIL